ncbi:MAG TPA: hypothetical protein VHL11_00740 [Phototrophicaceae bacterium]|jgi:hypothetical protein|nr:hypothetical protein [Phototrophicaceae bacterium]
MAAKATVESDKTSVPRRWNLARRFLERFWFVHASVIMMVNASPVICLQTLAVAARPSSDRLHHRNLFASGRRYNLLPDENGFRLTTTSKVSWYYRRRTRSAAVMQGTLQPMNDSETRIQLENHISLSSLIEFSLIPTFMTSVIIFVPYWHPSAIIACIVILYGLSWLGHRYNAALEANEMVFFVQKALEDLEPAALLAPGAENPDVVYEQREFEVEWEKFYRRHSDDI